MRAPRQRDLAIVRAGLEAIWERSDAMTRRTLFLALAMAALIPALAACGGRDPLSQPSREEEEERPELDINMG